MSSMTTVARVHQNSVEAVHHGVARTLRHVGSDVEELRVPDILEEAQRGREVRDRRRMRRHFDENVLPANLCDFPSAEVGEPLQRQRQDVGRSMDCEALGRRHFLFAPVWTRRTTNVNNKTLE